MKVLVIDDEPDVMEVVNLCFSLRWPEADVTSAKDAEEGLKYLEKDPPDIILLDIVLPGMDGFQLCQEVRRISDVPIVMLSARDGEVDKVRGLEMAQMITSRSRSVTSNCWPACALSCVAIRTSFRLSAKCSSPEI